MDDRNGPSFFYNADGTRKRIKMKNISWGQDALSDGDMNPQDSSAWWDDSPTHEQKYYDEEKASDDRQKDDNNNNNNSNNNKESNEESNILVDTMARITLRKFDHDTPYDSELWYEPQEDQILKSNTTKNEKEVNKQQPQLDGFAGLVGEDQNLDLMTEEEAAVVTQREEHEMVPVEKLDCMEVLCRMYRFYFSEKADYQTLLMALSKVISVLDAYIRRTRGMFNALLKTVGISSGLIGSLGNGSLEFT